VAGFAALVARSIRSTANRAYLWYAPILFTATGLLFAKSLVYARLFSVESFGALNQALLVATTFGNFAGAGLQLLGHKLLPQYYARGQADLAANLLACSSRFFGVAAVIGAVVIGVAVLFGWLHGAGLWSAALLYAVAQAAFMLRLIDIKSRLRFLEHARLSSARAVIILTVGGTIAATSHNVTATLAVEGLVTLLLATPLYFGSRGGEIRRKSFGSQSSDGWLAANLPAALSLLWLNGTLTLLYAIDRWAGMALLDQHEYGIYSLGLVILVVFETLQAVVNVAAYPLMGRMIAEGQHQRAFRLATLATLVVGSLTAVLYIPFVLGLDSILRAYLPAYLASSAVIKLAVLAGSLRLADFYASFAILCNEEHRLAWLFGALTLLATGGFLIASRVEHIQFDPFRMGCVTLTVAICAFAVNLSVATRAWRRLSPLVLA